MHIAKSSEERQLAADAKLVELRKQLAQEEKSQRELHATAQRRLARLHKDAGKAHTQVVLDLYDLLGIAPEHPRQRVIDDGSGQQRRVDVSTDKSEQLRSQRLYDAVAQLVQLVPTDRLSSIQAVDAAGRKERHAKRMAARE